ncbi:MDR family MFS transporter [Arthrobacter woluwensis]|uniref:MDR family MFS transporter n=1 Tax=Arthrobacter woluwensis TaxID=156980 RepID=UPI001AAE33A1|nr:MDR family MFS transporter [Arthrobacter woluwensis]QTF73420.1 DHA2 family efflux MFS transporter permease subunit [Arthrobacter woluwensis]
MSHRQIMEAFTGLLAAFFTAIVSSTIVSNALPTIISDLKGTQTDFAWVITASMLASAVTTPIWGKLADLYDKKILVQLSIVVFVAGSVVAGLSPDIPMLLTARVIQGIGMGGLIALSQAIMGVMIAPRERGKYSGYLGAVLAVGTAGGPLLGGLIVDHWGWRWTFYVCVPLAIIALILLQITLKLPQVRRKAKIDWLGTILLSASVSTLLIWVSFAGNPDYYEWWSWQTAAMVGGSVVGLLLFILVEAKVSEPIIPLKIISNRTTALSIVASVAIGVAMFGSSSFIGQYFQVARGATPTEAGLLTLPMIFTNLVGSTVAGQLISRYGKWKGYLVAGTILTAAGMLLLGTIDHETDFWITGIYMAVLGLGLGMTMQNLVLAVQNTVAPRDIGSASASVAFFRTVGGAIGVSVLGAVLGNRSSDLIKQGFIDHHIQVPAGSGASSTSLDVKDMPGPIATIVKAAYGDASAQIFLIAGFVAIAAIIAVLFIKEVPLRKTVEMQPAKAASEGSTAEPDTTTATLAAVAAPSGAAGEALANGLNPSDAPEQHVPAHVAEHRHTAPATHDGGLESGLDSELRLLLAEREAPGVAPQGDTAATLAALQQTQLLLAKQQEQLAKLSEKVNTQLLAQLEMSERQGQAATELAKIQAELDAERQLQKEAALYLATRGRHSAG